MEIAGNFFSKIVFFKTNQWVIQLCNHWSNPNIVLLISPDEYMARKPEIN